MCLALTFCGWVASAAFVRANDFQLRTGTLLVQPLTADTSVTWRSELRFDHDLRRVDSTFWRAGLAWRWLQPTKLTADLTYYDLRVKVPTTGDTHHAEQLWVGVGQSSRWWVSEHLGVSLRNTLRWRFIEGLSGPTVMTRHYGELTWRTGWAHGVQQFYSGFEWFEGLSNRSVPEHWITPLGARMRVSERGSFNLYSFIRHRKIIGKWRTNHVVGAFLTWQL